jgi:predicted nucleic acid-binding protein
MLLDTSGLLCLHYQTEPFHSKAVEEYEKAIVHLTHSYIIAEYVALETARRFPRKLVLDFITDLLADRHWYRLARSYKRCNTGCSRNQANLE